MPQDHAAAFEQRVAVFDWMRARGKPRDDDQAIRATLGEIMLKRPNIILMDEPTNHLDMESIESLNLALENYPGTVVFVSHDREFVSSVATRIIEFTPTGIIDFTGSYDDYLKNRGITIDLKRAASQ